MSAEPTYKEKFRAAKTRLKAWFGPWLRKNTKDAGYSCDLCGQELLDYPERRLCLDCEAFVRPNDARKCPKCGRKTVAEGLCLVCKSYAPAFDEGVSALVYDRFAAGMVLRFKNGRRYLKYYFGKRLLSALFSYTDTSSVSELQAYATEKWGDDFFLVPVPMSKDGLKERGFNQAEELALELSALTGFPCRTDVLRKVRSTLPQKDLTKKERRENVRGAYRIKDKQACRDKVVLLVDDVMTTAATGSECAKVFKDAGAKKVIFLTVASLEEKRELSVRKINL